jgi:ankyrin repeat protein
MPDYLSPVCTPESPIYIAALNGNRETLKRLCALSNKEVDTKANNGKTPLHIAVENGDEESVRILLDAGANAKTSYCFWWTAIDFAKSGQKPEHQRILKLLETHLQNYPDGIKPRSKATEYTPLFSLNENIKQYSTSVHTELSELPRKNPVQKKETSF